MPFTQKTRDFEFRSIAKNISMTYRVITVMGFMRLCSRVESKFGKKIAKLFFVLTKIVTLYSPILIIKFFPKSFTLIFASCAQSLNFKSRRVFEWANVSAKSSYAGHRKASFFIKANYMYENCSETDFENFIEFEVFHKEFTQELLDFYLVWSFHNNSQSGHSKLLHSQTIRLKHKNSLIKVDTLRYLPEHTTNMGHLGYLFLYSNFYRLNDPDREIVIWPDQSPNKYYLTQLLKILPFKILELKGKPELYQYSITQVDTLQYSQLPTGDWRLEASAAVPTQQDFPEMIVTNEFKLPVDDGLDEIALPQLKSLGFDKNKWFVALHVKEDRYRQKSVIETRDSHIEAFYSTCKLIYELGGQVVRMGGSDFPILEDNFPAIDYAHSKVKSEKLDYWLWSNCKFWIGNGNGAAVAIIPFKKPRLLVDLWPIHSFGPPTDFYLPKLIYDSKENRLLSPSEIVSMKFSRAMKKDLMTKSGFALIDSSSDLIKESTLELFNCIESKSRHGHELYSGFEIQINNVMNISSPANYMKIPKSFNFYLEYLNSTLCN